MYITEDKFKSNELLKTPMPTDDNWGDFKY